MAGDEAEAATLAGGENHDLIIETRNAAAVVTFDRPRALNALSIAMRQAISEALPGFARDPVIYALVLRSNSARAFCCGGDVREMTALGARDPEVAARMLGEEYRLIWALECFSKPTVALMDGLVMGSGVGLTLYGTHRVGAAGYTFAMPETAVGLFPDVGVTYTLARLPDQIGVYLALTGARLNRADALSLGLLTHTIDASRFDEITARMTQAEPVDVVLDELHEAPGAEAREAATLTRERRDVIARCFGGASVEAILEALEQVRGAEAAWAASIAADLRTKSPLSLKVSLRYVRAAAMMDLREVLQTDALLVQSFVRDSDFAEGARALLIDKDGAPQWSPATLDAVEDVMLDRYFDRAAYPALDLPLRSVLQDTQRGLQ
ncbi:MAG: enoyl-CoA hydratase/isomerase family protein [Pseudomonadota bacterium]